MSLTPEEHKELHKLVQLYLRDEFENHTLPQAHPCIQRFYWLGWVTQGFVNFHVSKLQGWKYEEYEPQDVQESSNLTIQKQE